MPVVPDEVGHAHAEGLMCLELCAKEVVLAELVRVDLTVDGLRYENNQFDYDQYKREGHELKMRTESELPHIPIVLLSRVFILLPLRPATDLEHPT